MTADTDVVNIAGATVVMNPTAPPHEWYMAQRDPQTGDVQVVRSDGFRCWMRYNWQRREWERIDRP